MLEDLDEVGVEPEVESSVAPVVAPSKPVIPDAMQVPYTADGKRIEKADYGKYGLDAGALSQATEKEALVASNRSIDLLRDKGRSLEKQLSQEKVSRAERLSDLPGRLEGGIQILSGQSVRGPVIIAPSIGSPIGPSLAADKNKPFSPALAPAFAESRGVNGDSSGSQSPTNQDGSARRRDNGAIAGERFQFPGSDNGLESTERIDLPGNVGGIAGRGPGGGGFGGGRVGGGDGELAQQRLFELTQEIARSEAALKGGQDAMMEHIWILEAQGKIRKNSMQVVDNSEQIAGETRGIESLELQRDQLTVVQKMGPGHSQIQALDIAINDRKAKIAELESQRARVTGRGPKQVLQSSIDSMKQQVNDLQNRIGEASRLAIIDSKARLTLLEANSGEQYEPIFENAFIAAKGPTAISTFSIDVDTASYANMRRMLNSGQRPPADSIRLEELVNYFKYDYKQPTGEHPFSVNLDLADCPWQDGHQLLRVGLKGKDVHVAERPATNVVFLIDVSGSMSSSDKLPLLKSGFKMMSRQLGENDRVSIVTYAGSAGVALAPTNGMQTLTINSAIERLSSGGSTHGSAGIKLAYELAQNNFIEGGVNRVMLATDGDLNVGVTSDDALVSLIKEKAAEGVFLTVLGFGSGNLKDAKLEKLADNGNGMYAYIDSTREARRVLVDQLSGSLVTIAKDVKIQVEFNPAEVKSYRLLGYENRMLETKDFDDDRKDAGEIGAGHTVTAIYQIEPTKAVARPVSLPAGMKYQVQTAVKADAPVDGEEDAKDGLSKAAMSGELATVALRYKQPEASESQRLEVSVKNEPKRFEEASDDFRFAASVAGFGMYLRGSKHRGAIHAELLQRIASGAIGEDKAGYRSEFIDLIRKASGR